MKKKNRELEGKFRSKCYKAETIIETKARFERAFQRLPNGEGYHI